MAKKTFIYKGKTLEELQQMSISELSKLFDTKTRRAINRGFNAEKKKFIDKVKKKQKIKTHLREMIILPEMVGKLIMIHNGKDYVPITIQEEMIGHRLGEFAQSRKRLQHSAPGVGATKSSSSVSVR